MAASSWRTVRRRTSYLRSLPSGPDVCETRGVAEGRPKLVALAFESNLLSGHQFRFLGEEHVLQRRERFLLELADFLCRETPNRWPISSMANSRPPSNPKRMDKMVADRGRRRSTNPDTARDRSRSVATANGEAACSSSRTSRRVMPSATVVVSSDNGGAAAARRLCAALASIRVELATSSNVGVRPSVFKRSDRAASSSESLEIQANLDGARVARRRASSS